MLLTECHLIKRISSIKNTKGNLTPGVRSGASCRSPRFGCINPTCSTFPCGQSTLLCFLVLTWGHNEDSVLQGKCSGLEGQASAPPASAPFGAHCSPLSLVPSLVSEIIYFSSGEESLLFKKRILRM